MQDFAAIDFEGYGMNIQGINLLSLAISCRCLNIPSHQLHLSAAACGFNVENRHNALTDAETCAYR